MEFLYVTINSQPTCGHYAFLIHLQGRTEDDTFEEYRAAATIDDAKKWAEERITWWGATFVEWFKNNGRTFTAVIDY